MSMYIRVYVSIFPVLIRGNAAMIMIILSNLAIN